MALRVLAVAQAAELGGAELVLPRLAPALAREDVEVEVATPGEGGLARACREQGLAVHELHFGPLRRGGWPRAVLAWPRARALVRATGADVVWLNGIVPQRLVPALAGTPALLHLHDLVEHRPAQWRGARFWRAVRTVVCDSEAVARTARAAGAPAARVRTVPVPVDAAEPAPRPPWADGRPVIGFVGRIEPRKGVLDLLAAVRELLPRVPGLRLVLVRGADVDPDRDYQRRALEAVADLGEGALLLGPVDDARALMPWFDVLCVPSLLEPFGTVAAEALAAGTPAVVTDSGGMPEYVVPGRSGEVVPPGDPAALAAALERVLPRAAAMADATRADAAQFATEGVARQMAGLLRESAAR